MKLLERLFIAAVDTLCQLLSVTPERLETIRRKRRAPPRPEDRPDVLDA